jgi:hypothetical protein
VRQLQKMLDEAGRTWGDYVYLQANLLSDGSTWKARILSASLNPRDNIMSVYSGGVLEFTLTLTREPVFRGAYASASWASGGTSKAFANGQVHALGALSTFVETPATIRIANSSGATKNYKRLWVGNDYITGGATLLQSPGLGNETVTGSNHAVYYGEKSLGDVSLFQGREWRIMACLNTGTDGVEIKGRLLFDIGGVYKVARTGLPVTLENSSTGAIVDLGSFLLPPNGKGGANDGISLAYSAWGTGSINVSSYALLPGFNLRQYCIAHADTYTVGNGAAVVDDPRDEGTAYLDAGSSHYPIVSVTGQPIMLMPDKANRIVAIVEEHNDFDPFLDFSVTVEYEQQRLLI